MESTKIKVKHIDPIYESCEDDFYEDDQGLHIVLKCQHNETSIENVVTRVYPDHRGEPVEVTADAEFCDNCDEEVVSEDC